MHSPREEYSQQKICQHKASEAGEWWGRESRRAQTGGDTQISGPCRPLCVWFLLWERWEATEWVWAEEDIIWLMFKYDHALALYYCVTNHCKLSGLTQPPCISLEFCRSAIWPSMAGCSLPSIMRLKSRFWLDWGVSWRLWEKNLLPGSHRLLAEFSSSRLWDWSSHLLVECNPGAALTSWRLPHSWPHSPSFFQVSSGKSNLSHAWDAWLPVVWPARGTLLLKGSCDSVRPKQAVSLS